MSTRIGRASIVFYVSDMTRTQAFYADALGIVLERQEGVEPAMATGTLAGGLELVFFEMAARRGESPALVFDMPDGGIDDLVTELARKGVTIVTPVSEAPGGWSADFVDPDGFGLGLWQAADLPRSLQ